MAEYVATIATCIALIAVAYIVGAHHGTRTERASWAALESSRSAVIEAQRVEQDLKVDRLNAEIEALRERLERPDNVVSLVKMESSNLAPDRQPLWADSPDHEIGDIGLLR